MNTTNQLYPIFVKLDQVPVLIVGGGKVALEKLHFLLKSSPNAKVKLVAPLISEEIVSLAQGHDVYLVQKRFHESDLKGKGLVIIATNDHHENQTIWKQAKAKNILTNVADTPSLCDFYLGGIVTKGDLKIAISTNGKSPTFAKRLRQVLEEGFPEDITDLLDNLNSFRKTLRGDFTYKVKQLNSLTSTLVSNERI